MINAKRCFLAATVVLIPLTLSLSPSQLRAEKTSSGLGPSQLQCEYLIDPLGIDVAAPRLSWALQTTDSPANRGQKQTAYQVLVASNVELLAKAEGDLWDSGKVLSDATLQVEYAGKPLASQTQYFWKVRVGETGGCGFRTCGATPCAH